MKKSTLAISALLLSTTAFAQTHELGVLNSPLSKATPEKGAPAKAAGEQTWKDLGEGTFSDFVMSNLFMGYFNDPVKVMVQESEQTPGMYRLVNPWKGNEGDVFDDTYNYLVIDATDPDYVMIPEQRAPLHDSKDGETWYCSYTDWAINVAGVTKELFTELQPDKVPQLRDGVIKFSQNCMAVMYPEGTGDEGVEPGTWTYANMEYEGYIILPGATFNDEWESMGMGRFLEGFLEPVFYNEYVPVEKEVEIMKNTRVEGVYKVNKAYDSPTSQDLVIDARQPDFVRVEEQNTGVNSSNGWIYVLSVSTNGPFTDYEGMVEYNPDYADRNITMDENGIYFPKDSMLLYFPMTGDLSAYTIPNAVDSYVLFPGASGIGSIANESETAPAEYYNLQGMRLTSPEAGQLVIVREGSKTRKMIYR